MMAGSLWFVLFAKIVHDFAVKAEQTTGFSFVLLFLCSSVQNGSAVQRFRGSTHKRRQ
jgi:hypothetical protein